MENLLVLLDKIQQLSPLDFFSKETIVVQNAGMQHWLNMSLAKQRGISMNVTYALPAQFLWKLIRSLASEEIVPEQSLYSREVLTWRLHALLNSAEVLADNDFTVVTKYWQQSTSNEEQAALKRYQLACQVADLYEQYLIFRPDWIDAWSKGEFNFGINDFASNTNTAFSELNDEIKDTACWQGKLWYLLAEQQAYNPNVLVKEALAGLTDKKHLLPQRLSFFGINAMAPIWLEFIHQLSQHVDVHFFHLNPCYDYWGDLLTEKQAVKNIANWTDGYQNNHFAVGNPLLANLGQQGREFMAMLQEYSTVNIEAFDRSSQDEKIDVQIDDIVDTAANKETTSLLDAIQHDILTLTDAKQNPELVKAEDSSVVITSAHSALREVQGMHDWLLHQFNQDQTLTPKDIIVMCPKIENYAPYIDAVFARGWQELDDNIPPLPCSIADRVSKDSEPVVAAFLEVLQLPDSRFQVSQLMGFLRLPAMQNKFGLSLEEIEKITLWLDHACVHWGLDTSHKNKLLGCENASKAFTWQQGLSRLLQGFAYGDQQSLFQCQMLLPDVEGSDSVLLGKLLWVIDRLQTFALELGKARRASQWQQFLFGLVDDLFDIATEPCFQDISRAIELLSEYCQQASYFDAISLSVVIDFLNNHFSQPDPGRQFMIGQVTFCSMVPMRSIPFKVVAILGLNDGEYPRQRQPLGFDLLANTPARLGDRSRRGDDRYLFLEAIISARQSLYLSYQGKNIKSNKDREPSIILREFIDYLEQGYQWTTSNGKGVRQLAMQPFSLQNYQHSGGSFDDKWLKLINYPMHLLSDNAVDESQHEAKVDTADKKRSQKFTVIPDESTERATELVLSCEQLISFFQHPSKSFAQQALNLTLTTHDINLEDVEPFSVNALESYQLRESLLELSLQALDEKTVSLQMNECFEQARLSGNFPDLPSTAITFDGWREDVDIFSDFIRTQLADNPEKIVVELNLTVNDPQGNATKVNLVAELPIIDDKVVFYRSSTAKAKDKFTLYIHQLMSQLVLEQSYETQGFYFDTKAQKPSQFSVGHIDNAQEKLQQLIEYFLLGHQQALLLNGDLATFYFKSQGRSKDKTSGPDQQQFEVYWHDTNAFTPFGNDRYISYFWPECPDIETIAPALINVYQDVFTIVQPVKLTSKKTVKGKG